MKRFVDKLPLILIFLIAVAFSIKSFREPDLWWQIRTGEWILENHQIPKQDVFSYTFEGTKWINVKWGFEVIAALLTRAGGPEFVFVLQALISCLIVFFLIKAAEQIRNQKSEIGNLTISFSLLLTLVAMEYRIIGRPEMFSHLFTVVFLFFLLQNRKLESNKIFWLIPLQIVWANFHEAFGTGIVLTAIFFAGNWSEYFLSKRKIIFSNKELPKKISILLVAQLASVVVNPNGIALLTQPLNILGQVYENKYSTELFSFTHPEYWMWNVYWVVGLLAAGILGCVIYYRTLKTKSSRLKLFIEHFGIAYLLTLVAFAYLALTAYRNIIFFVLVFFPLLVFGIDSLVSRISAFQKFSKQISIGFCVLLFAFYVSIVSNKYYEFTDSRDRFGMEVLSTYNATGAADFVKQKNLKGKCFSDYLTSSYLLWKLQPDFKTFIDLRDLDVFPSSFFSTFAEAVTFPEFFLQLDSVHHFEYVILYRPQFTSLHNYLFNSSNFQLAFADAVAEVYTRKTVPANAEIPFTPLKPVAVSVPAMTVNKILNPFYNSFDYSKVDNDLLAAVYHIAVKRLGKAEEYAQKSSTNHIEDFRGFQMLGEVYYNRAMESTTAEAKSELLSTAANYYKQSLNQKDDLPASYLGLGAVYYYMQNYVMALENLESCIRYDPLNLGAYNFAAECCKNLANTDVGNSDAYIKKAISFYRKADKLNPDNPPILINLGFLYFRVNDCDNSVKFLSRVTGYEGLSAEDKRNIEGCLQKCGK